MDSMKNLRAHLDAKLDGYGETWCTDALTELNDHFAAFDDGWRFEQAVSGLVWHKLLEVAQLAHNPAVTTSREILGAVLWYVAGSGMAGRWIVEEIGKIRPGVAALLA